MPQKFPPPPLSATKDQQFNRWLIEIQSLLNDQGIVDPANVVGLVAAYAEIAALALTSALHTAQISALTTTSALHTTQIATLNSEVAANTASIVTLNAEVASLFAAVATNTTNIATNTANIATLTARNQILNGAGVPGAGLGTNGDLYSNTTGGAGTNLYSKRGGAWVAIA